MVIKSRSRTALIRSLELATHVMDFFEQTIIGKKENSESCGLLGGWLPESGMGIATLVIPLENLSVLSHSFAVDPEQVLQKQISIKKLGLIPLSLYHSHIGNSICPSYRDLELPSLTGFPSLIIGKSHLGGLHFFCYDDVGGEITTIRVSLPKRDGFN